MTQAMKILHNDIIGRKSPKLAFKLYLFNFYQSCSINSLLIDLFFISDLILEFV